MAEQKSLYFTIGTDAEGNTASDAYLDIAAALTTVNRKQFHQFTKKGDPLCYAVSIKALTTNASVTACVAPNSWTTRNAAKKTAMGWITQLKNADIRLNELPTYARRFRAAFEYGAHTSGAGTQTLLKHLVPDDCAGKRLFTAYDAPDGTSVTYSNSNEITLLPLEEAKDYRPALIGETDGTNTSFGMIYEFLKSRRNMREETDMTTEFPDDDGLMNSLFAVSEELADDVVSAVDDYNTLRPYTEEDAHKAVHGATVQAQITNFVEDFVAPLGLIKFEGLANGDKIQLDIRAIYEM